MNTAKTNFQKVQTMNEAFNNVQGDVSNIDFEKLRKQCISIGHEFAELLLALGASTFDIEELVNAIDHVKFPNKTVLKNIRDALCDIHVFAYGAHHYLGYSADMDMDTVLTALMTRFVKNDEDKAATIAMHAEKGVTEVYFENHYPIMIIKSTKDQPDAPKDKFLKSASYSEPIFSMLAMPTSLAIKESKEKQTKTGLSGAFNPL